MANQTKTKNRLLRLMVQREVAALMGLIAIFLLFSILSKQFFTLYNIMIVGRQASLVAITAIGMSLVIITGGIDLSVGSISALSGVCVATLIINFGFSAFTASIVGILVGGLAGLINGMIITRFRVPPIIATLAMMNVARGVVLAFTGGYPVSGIIGSFSFLGRGFVGKVPVPVILIGILYIVGFLLLEKTVFGAHLYGVGGNEHASGLAGVNVDKVKLLVYGISGVTAAITGLIMTSRLGSGQPLAGQGLELDAIAAAVIGGISVLGGEGRILGTLVGSLIIAILNNGLDLLGVGSYYQMAITGVVIVVAVSASVRQSRMDGGGL